MHDDVGNTGEREIGHDMAVAAVEHDERASVGGAKEAAAVEPVGFAGNEIAAQVRLHAGRRLSSPALVADGNNARADGFVSLGVVASAAAVAFGVEIADPIIGLLITLVILRITWDSWHTVSTTEPGKPLEPHEH